MRRLLAPGLAALCLLAGLARRGEAFGAGDKGTSAAAFLKIAPSARPAGMGEAFAAVADDVGALYYNPAGIGTLKDVEASGSHTALFQDMNFEYAAISVPLLSWTKDPRPKNALGTLGFSVTNLTVSGIERRGTTETDSAIDTFGSSDFAYALSYGVQVPGTGLALGATARYIDLQLDTNKAQAFSMDLGALYRREKASFAFGARNAGSSIRFNTQADPQPTTIYGGAAYKLSDAWQGSFELDQPRDNGVQLGFGAEYKHDFGDKLVGFGRFGYNTKNTAAGGLNGLTFGLGLGYSNFAFDFALEPFGDLGNVFKYSLTAKF